MSTMEYGQSFIIRRNESLHNFQAYMKKSDQRGESAPLLAPAGQNGKRPLAVFNNSNNNYYSSSSSTAPSLTPPPVELPVESSLRFQVVVWNIGKLDVIEGRVPMTFRVTMFWNDITSVRANSSPLDDNESMDSSCRSAHRWEMSGRQSAVKKEIASDDGGAVSVPPVSLLNVVTFNTIGSPEVALLREDVGLWRWTCMYRATLIQEHWRVDDFPHDCHDICLKMAVFAHLKPCQQWDRRYWNLSLATEDDSQGTTRIPHGLVVDDMCIPEFSFDETKGLEFNFSPLNHGPGGGVRSGEQEEQCLTVKLRVRRDSYYYDRNVVPLLGMLNFVAITITALAADRFF